MGGQIVYLVELAKAIGQRDDVCRVDLSTRLIADDRLSEDYAQPVETVDDEYRIMRIRCGGARIYAQGVVVAPPGRIRRHNHLTHKKQTRVPDVVHGHHPDAGYVAAMLAEIFGVPLVYTGHSLGRSKLSRLLNEGMTAREIIKKIPDRPPHPNRGNHPQ